ncbi:MAG TPA: c-type cytochrome [Campylobacterales bacterium]|nr:c-type cytochrome [Campylobacterales bacterium]
MEGGEATKTEAKAEAPVAQKAEAPKVEAPAPVAEEKAEAPKVETAPASAEVSTAACAGCHGANFEKKAMGVSKVVNTLTKDEIKKALHGYKDGTYGGSMKTIMKGQATPLSDAQIEAIANKVGK